MANLPHLTSTQPSELNLLWWVAALALAVCGVLVAPESWIAGMMLIAFGAVVSPYAFSRILAWLSANDPVQIRIALVLVALVSSTWVLFTHTAQIEADAVELAKVQALADAKAAEAKQAAETAEQLRSAKAYFEANRADVLAEFGSAIDGKNLATATAIRNRFILAVQDPEFDQVLNRYVDLKNEIERAEADKARKAKIVEVTTKLASVGATDYDQAITIYNELLALDAGNKIYQQKLDRMTKARDAQAAKQAAEKAEAAAQAERQKKIEAQFSGWDGSHRTFERMIKQAMNDPNSYDHVETKYIDKGSFIRVFCTFRGKNAFGGLVVNTKVADFSIDGDFIKEVR